MAHPVRSSVPGKLTVAGAIFSLMEVMGSKEDFVARESDLALWHPV
jgi:hypothetical protein